jgi:hypothetical protein
MHGRWLAALALAASACGSSPAPSSPTPTPNVPPLPTTVTLTGHVAATNGGQPLPAVMAAFSSAITATTDATGTFTMRFNPGTVSRLSLTADTIIPRTLTVAVSTTRSMDVDAIATAGFDLGYYRAIARNGVDHPEELQVIRHWTQAPKIYLRTIDEAGRSIDAVTLDSAAATLINNAGRLTGDHFGLAGMEQGTDRRDGQTGWITVIWTAEAADYCGRATVGLDGGIVELAYRTPGCGCGTSRIRPRTVKHELGHAMGLYHTPSRAELMYGGGSSACDTPFSEREYQYTRIIYARPVGNRDIDDDPVEVVNLTPYSIR